VRMLVGAGAAGGIAGAFGAPFAGAAYGFELIVGSYTVATLAPVVAASVAGTLVARALIGHTYHIPLGTLDVGQAGNALTALLLGILCGLLSVVLMRGVTMTERLFYNSGLRTTLRPVAGGILVGIIAIFVPHVLGSGHQAMALLLHEGWPVGLLAVVLAAKIAASALSIRAGFRGGLFSTSLFLGAVTGALVGQIGFSFGLLASSDVAMLSLVGMASFGAAVIGAPMTMALLAAEVTGELSVVGAVLLGVVAATLTVRQVFGYSFATWRFHLRGEAILGGEDVGWARQTTARDLMRRDLTIAPVAMQLSEFRSQFPLGSTKFVAVIDQAGAFVGLADVADILRNQYQMKRMRKMPPLNSRWFTPPPGLRLEQASIASCQCSSGMRLSCSSSWMTKAQNAPSGSLPRPSRCADIVRNLKPGNERCSARSGLFWRDCLLVALVAHRSAPVHLIVEARQNQREHRADRRV
jgi:CIC family chloride channel protein